MREVSDRRPSWTTAAAIRRVRPLGEDLQPPRTRYFTHIPFFLAFTGIATWVVGTEFSMVVGSIVGGVIGLYMFLDWLLRGPTRFSTTIAFGLLTGYGLGAYNTWATTSRGGLSLGEFLGYDDAVLARGMGAVLLTCAATVFLGELFERPVFGRDFRLFADRRIYTFVYLGTAIVMGALGTGAFSFTGNAADANGHVGVLTAFILWVFSPLVALTVAVFLLTPWGSWNKILTGACAAAMLILLVVVGRRILLYTIVETIFLCRITGVRLRGGWQKKLLIAILVGAFIVTGALGFMLVRLAGYGSSKRARSLPERITLILRWASEGTAFDRALTSTQNNVKTRTFILGFFSNVLEGASNHTPGLGQNTIGLLQVSIPSIIYPNKDRFYSEEDMTNRLFGFSYIDEANSILTNGATDFGLAGALIYPLIVAWVYRLFTECICWRVNQFAVLVATLGTILSAIVAENSLSMIADALVHGTLFSICIVIFFALPRFQLQRPQELPSPMARRRAV